ncbi:hypothetical protein [Desulforamulus aeronauticus]|uniref:Uncharacterized protein n=1 Tax=Desulforamulus aeronauticus DSM 10349 TaxID=1121421 RepID=A0A1M6WHE3_9FIRM|nr:hypothetical protein [Desulforamulus aeronauticus]SHK93034.1 hypothetical protein SAMN02745123_03632 [Desulforamulus aeronauticus DSM 10349]
MPNLTPNLGLKKPLGNENVSRQAYNENLDLLDQNVAKKADLTALLAEEAKIILSAEEPINPNKNTLWLVNHGEAPVNFSSGGGGGVVIANATTGDSPPATDYWFQKI